MERHLIPGYTLDNFFYRKKAGTRVTHVMITVRVFHLLIEKAVEG